MPPAAEALKVTMGEGVAVPPTAVALAKEALGKSVPVRVTLPVPLGAMVPLMPAEAVAAEGLGVELCARLPVPALEEDARGEMDTVGVPEPRPEGERPWDAVAQGVGVEVRMGGAVAQLMPSRPAPTRAHPVLVVVELGEGWPPVAVTLADALSEAPAVPEMHEEGLVVKLTVEEMEPRGVVLGLDVLLGWPVARGAPVAVEQGEAVTVPVPLGSVEALAAAVALAPPGREGEGVALADREDVALEEMDSVGGALAVYVLAAEELADSEELAEGGEEAVAVMQAVAVPVSESVLLVVGDRDGEEVEVPAALAVGVAEGQDVPVGVPVPVAVEVTVEDAETVEVEELQAVVVAVALGVNVTGDVAVLLTVIAEVLVGRGEREVRGVKVSVACTLGLTEPVALVLEMAVWVTERAPVAEIVRDPPSCRDGEALPVTLVVRVKGLVRDSVGV